MAKEGHYNQHSIVEIRPDHTNVNNWHWVERDATNWTKDKLTSLLKSVEVKPAGQGGWFRFGEFDSFDGDAIVYNRKSGLRRVVEVTFSLKFTAGYEDEVSDDMSGTIQVVDYVLPERDYQLEVDFDECDATQKTQMKAFINEFVRKRIDEALLVYEDQLLNDFSKGMLLPSAKPSSSEATKTLAETAITREQEGRKKEKMQAAAGQSAGVRIPTKMVELTKDFMCSGHVLYEILTNAERMKMVFRGSACSLEAECGGRFSFLDGNIKGSFVQLVPDKLIQMRWHVKGWPTEHYSTVTITLEEQPPQTQLKLVQKGVPENEVDATKENWQSKILEGINTCFGIQSGRFF